MKEIKRIAFDMDGTIADLYGTNGWLDSLIKHKPIFDRLQPMLNMLELNSILKKLMAKGYEVMIITWLPKKATKAYKLQCRKEKKEWLQEFLPEVKIIHAVQYGTDKHRVTKNLDDCLLFDDIQEIRNKWEKFGGVAKDQTQIMETLEGLLEK